jgi:hypothetical protein
MVAEMSFGRWLAMQTKTPNLRPSLIISSKVSMPSIQRLSFSGKTDQLRV